METIKVSSKSNSNKVAGALTALLKENDVVEVQTVGAGALNQSIKAIAIARGFLAPSGKNITCIPTFADVKIDDITKTAIKLIIEVK